MFSGESFSRRQRECRDLTAPCWSVRCARARHLTEDRKRQKKGKKLCFTTFAEITRSSHQITDRCSNVNRDVRQKTGDRLRGTVRVCWLLPLAKEGSLASIIYPMCVDTHKNAVVCRLSLEKERTQRTKEGLFRPSSVPHCMATLFLSPPFIRRKTGKKTDTSQCGLQFASKSGQ